MKEYSKFAVVKRPIVTEKSMAAANEKNTYTFEVAKDATKEDISRAVEELFNVTVGCVRVVNVFGKPRRVRWSYGRTRGWKKAMVTLTAGRIDLI